MNSTTKANSYDFIHNINLTNCILATILNGLVAISIIFVKKINSYTDFLFFLNSLFLMLFGLFSTAQLIDFIRFGLESNMRRTLLTIIRMINYFSPLILLLLSYHRYRLIKYPRAENEHISTIKIIKIFQIIIAIFSLGMLECFYPQPFINIPIMVLFFILPAILCFIFLALTISSIRSKRNKISKYNIFQRKKLNKDTKAILCLSLMLLNLVLLLFPQSILSWYYLINYYKKKATLYYIFHGICLTYRINDPIFLLIFNNSIRKDFIRLFYCKCRS